MPRYLIERNVPGVHRLNADGLKNLATGSNAVLRSLGPDIQWIHSYVTENKIFCVYRSPNEDMIREHGRLGEFPIESITEIRTIIDPSTAE